MSRNDAELYTGMTSPSARLVKEAQQKHSNAKENKRGMLLPAAEIVNTEIEKIRDEIAQELGHIIHIEMKVADIKALVAALRLADSRMVILKTRLNNVLRAPRSATKEVSEVEDE